MPRKLPKGVVDAREYKKNNQIRGVKTIFIEPFKQENGVKYFVGSLPKDSYILFLRMVDENGNVSNTGSNLGLGDITDENKPGPNPYQALFGGDIWANGNGQTKGYIIVYAETRTPTTGFYADYTQE